MREVGRNYFHAVLREVAIERAEQRLCFRCIARHPTHEGECIAIGLQVYRIGAQPVGIAHVGPVGSGKQRRSGIVALPGDPEMLAEQAFQPVRINRVALATGQQFRQPRQSQRSFACRVARPDQVRE